MTRYRPFAPGDVNAFFGLMLDNVANLLLCVGLLSAVYNFPATFAVRYMLIAFLPFIEVIQHPVAGFVSLGIILMTLVARLELPAHLPGALVALLVGGAVFYVMRAIGLTHSDSLTIRPGDALWPTEWLAAFRCQWLAAWGNSLACLPALASSLAMIYADQILGATQQSIVSLAKNPATALTAETLQTLRTLSSGFIITSLLWASTLAMLIDRRYAAAAAFLLTAATCSLLGVIHSPLAGSPLAMPWHLPIDQLPSASTAATPVVMASSYAAMALVVLAGGYLLAPARADALP